MAGDLCLELCKKVGVGEGGGGGVGEGEECGTEDKSGHTNYHRRCMVVKAQLSIKCIIY